MKTLITLPLRALLLFEILESSLSKCPDRYVDLGTGCYHFSVQENMRWHQAYFICFIELDGYLVEIESEQEQNNLRHHIETVADPEEKYTFWIGATSLLQETVFRWMTSGNLLTFTAWEPKNNEPDNLYGIEDCTMLNRAIYCQWYDVECNRTSNSAKLIPKAICETVPV